VISPARQRRPQAFGLHRLRWLVLVWLAGLCACARPPEPLRAQDGFLDLSAVDFASSSVRLLGDWELYWGELRPPDSTPAGQPGPTADRMSPGESWAGHRLHSGTVMTTSGVLTMRLRLRLPRGKPDDPWALRAVTMKRPFMLRVRDTSGRALMPELVAGRVSTDLSQIAATKQNLLRALLPVGGGPDTPYDDIEIFLYGGSRAIPDRSINYALSLGRESVLRAEQRASEQVQLIIIGVSLVIGLYNLAMFILRRSETAPLFFGLFCVLIASRQLTLHGFLEAALAGQAWPPGRAWALQQRIEYVSLYAAVPMFVLYLRSLFPQHYSRRVAVLISALFGLSCVWMIVLPMNLAAASLRLVEKTVVLVALYVLFCMARALRSGTSQTRQTAQLIALGTLILVAATINDVLHVNRIIHTFVAEHFGMFSFIFAQAFVLAENNARARRQAETLAGELDRKNSALSRLDRMKDEFLANTSHELRTPLSGIIGLAEALRSQPGLPVARVNEHLHLIIASGKRLASLVNDILDFAKLRYDHLTLQQRPVDPRVVTELVLSLVQPLLAGRPLRIENQLPDPCPLVFADENRLQQILTNLVGNAVKFTPAGLVAVSAQVRERMLAISVSDTGVGIPPHERDRIFESFSQIDGTAQRESGGTGLGLAISRELVHLHGGELGVESTVGVGSTFSFTLPLAPAGSTTAPAAAAVSMAAEPPLPPEQALASQSAAAVSLTDYRSVDNLTEPALLPLMARGSERFRVLIVDDDPINRAVLDSQLRGAGYEVAQEESGPAALHRLTQQRFDAVVLDVMMPKMSGYEVLRRLRPQHQASELPVLLLTARTQEQDIVEGFRAGSNDFLTKPFSRTELLSRIETHITLAKTHIAYGRFVPHEFISLLGKKNVVYVDIGDHVHLPQLSILFCDVRGFTSLAENMDAGGVFLMLGRLLSRISPILREHQGFVDKFIGDAVMGLFPQSPTDAARAALKIRQAVQALARSDESLARLDVGLGIHTGSTMLGTIGDADRMEATVLSDAVNLAARLEGLTRAFGVGILISDFALSLIADPAELAPRALGRVRVRGKRQSIVVHELLASDDPATRRLKQTGCERFLAAVAQFQARDFSAAQVEFRALAQAAAQAEVTDGPVLLYIAQCQHFLAHPPGDDWDGYLEFSSK
jgi:two-component system sensor histidine kinase ChiS